MTNTNRECWVALIIGIVIGCVIGGLLVRESMTMECIRNGVGYYNPTNGVFTLKNFQVVPSTNHLTPKEISVE